MWCFLLPGATYSAVVSTSSQKLWRHGVRRNKSDGTDGHIIAHEHMSAARLSRALVRLGLQSAPPAAGKAARTAAKASSSSARTLLRVELARSLDDGTKRGAAVAARFRELSKLVCSVLGQHHHELAVRLQDTYKSYDPSGPPPVEAEAPSSSGSSDFSSAIHAVLRSAGFRLCSREDEVIAVDTHFGDEAVWNVPVSMTWSALNESLVQTKLGGFDAYAVEREAGRPVSKPRWADKLIVYHRGVGTLEKRGAAPSEQAASSHAAAKQQQQAAARAKHHHLTHPPLTSTGYFIVPKLEEMVIRSFRRLAWRLLSPFTTRLTGTYKWAEQTKMVGRAKPYAVSLANQLGLSGSGGGGGSSSDGSSGSDGGGGSGGGSDGAVEVSNSTERSNNASALACLTDAQLSWWSLFEETTLSAPTHKHVLLAYRHTDAVTEAHNNTHHIALALFRNVPHSDVDMLMPHTQVGCPHHHHHHHAHTPSSHTPPALSTHAHAAAAHYTGVHARAAKSAIWSDGHLRGRSRLSSPLWRCALTNGPRHPLYCWCDNYTNSGKVARRKTVISAAVTYLPE